MLPVKSGLIPRTITQERVSGVARGAVEKVLHNTEDHSQYMGPVDSFLDIFCDGVKRAAITRINGISHHSAILSTELEKPAPDRRSDFINSEIREIDQNTKQLSKLAFGKTLEFGYRGDCPVVNDNGFLVCRDPAKIAPMGFALYPSRAPEVNAEGVQLPPIVLTFERIRDINIQDLERLRISERIKCRNKEYLVRFTTLDEPIVLQRCPDSFARAVQSKLSTLWIVEQADHLLAELHAVTPLNMSLQFPSFFPESDVGEIRTAEQLATVQNWKTASDLAVQNVQIMAQRMQDKLTIDKAKLIRSLRLLIRGEVSIDAQRNLLLNTKLEVEAFKKKRGELADEMIRFKASYSKLYSLAIGCNLKEMRCILLARFNNFNHHFSQYNALHAAEGQGQRFLAVQNTETEFLQNFSASQLENCLKLLNPSPITLKYSISLRPPTSLRERAQLVALLSNPEEPWRRIRDAMENLKNAQNSFLDTERDRHDLISAIDRRFKAVKGKNGDGLDPATGKTFYTPETFSRIISIFQEETALLDTTRNFSVAILNRISAAIGTHFHFIDQETQAIDENQKGSEIGTHRKPKMYAPKKINGEFMNHLQWKNYQRLKELELLETST